jgi:hypothetical protein
MEIELFKKIKDLKKNPLFVFVRQCLSKNLTEIHLNRVINYLTRKLRRKWVKKVNVECDTDENFKDDQRFFTFFLLICSDLSWEQNFCIKMYFFINTYLIHVNLLYKRLSYRVKRQFIWNFQTFSLFPYKMRNI